MKEVYTVEKHVKQLVAMMCRDEPCNYCPAAKGQSMRECPTDLWDCDADFPCRICREFVGLPFDENAGRWIGEMAGCPCNALGGDEALRRTFEALKAYQREMINNGQERS
jgi:hypothetical protein